MSDTLLLPGISLSERAWKDTEQVRLKNGRHAFLRNVLVTKPEQLEAMVRVVRASRRCSYDSETSGLTPALGAQIVGHAMGVRAGEDYFAQWYVPVRHRDASVVQLPPEVVARAIADALDEANAECALHHAKFDQGQLRNEGVAIRRRVIDVSIRATIANENERAFGLKALAREYVIDEAEEALDGVEAFMRRDAQKLGIPFKKRRRGEEDDQGEPTYMERFGHSRVPVLLEGPYACRDVFFTSYLADHYEWTERTFSALHAREHAVSGALLDMEWHGLPFDIEEVRRAQEQARAECEVYLAIIRKHTRENFEVKDSAIRDLFFKELKLAPPKLTKGGKKAERAARDAGDDEFEHRVEDYAADKEAREILAEQYPEHRELILAINAYARATKIATTYTGSMLRYYSPKTGCIHPSYNQLEQRDEGGVPVTGRLSSASPNIQNQAKKAMHLYTCGCADCVKKWAKGEIIGPERKPGPSQTINVRRYFTVPEGYLRAYIDFSQIELRILTWLSRDPVLLDCYANDRDVHEITANDVTGGDRDIAKQVNFGNSYGMTEIGLAKRMKGYAKDPEGTRERAKVVLDAFFKRYAGIPRFRQEFANLMRARGGMFVSPFGRPRRIPAILSANRWERERAERMMMSSIVSGTAADLMKEVMIAARLWLAQADSRALCRQTIHDELVYDLPIDNAAPLLSGVMHITTTWPMFESGGVPIRANCAVTYDRWENKREIVLAPDGRSFRYAA